MSRVVLSALVLVACGSSESGRVGACVPGKQEACPCAGGGSSVQLCKDDGSGYLPCACGAADVANAADAADATSALSDGTAHGPETPLEVWAPKELPVTPPFDGFGDVTPTPSCKPCGTGPVKGVVCAPSEQHYIPGAKVTIDAIGCDGQPVHLETTTKLDGSYYFPEVPCGDHFINVVAGSFHVTYAVDVAVGTGIDVTGAGKKQCFKAKGIPIAVFWGQWDHQHELLDKLGFEYTFFNFKDEYFNNVPAKDIEAVQVLRDPAALAKFKILFFNCGSAALGFVHDFPEIKKNLKAFVEAGGSMYASDLSWAYIEGAFPNAIDFHGSDDLPTGPQALNGPQHAKGQQSVPATIIDTDLSAYAGASVFTAKYGPGPLILVEAPGLGTLEHVRGPVVTDKDTGLFQPPEVVAGPLVLSFRPSPGSGSVVFTTFHNDEQADELMKKILDYLVFKL